MLDYGVERLMGLASQSALTEAIAAARAGDRSHARELLSKLLRADSANPEYWIWMSSVVDSEREKIYCLESALKLDPSNRAALRGLVILGARNPEEAELASAVKIARRQTASTAADRRSKTVVENPARRRFSAMGRPMFPRPITPSRIDIVALRQPVTPPSTSDPTRRRSAG